MTSERCCLIDDGSSQLIAVEDADEAVEKPQALWVRVGMVYDGGVRRDEPGIWVEYQERYMAAPLSGSVLLTPALWEELANAVDERLSRNGEYTRIDKLVKAVRAVHRKYKDKCAELASLRQENTALQNDLRRCQAGIAAQNELVRLAEDVLRIEHGK
jgi:hypothetical protein